MAMNAPIRNISDTALWEDSLKLGRSVPLARLWDWLVRLRPKQACESVRRMSSIVLLERM
jgi:hypothetical protein